VSMLDTSIRDTSICLTNSRLIHTFDQINFAPLTHTECVHVMPSLYLVFVSGQGRWQDIFLLIDLIPKPFFCFAKFWLLFPGFCSGDFGNENVELVQSIASLEFAKAVILGNHDSWFTQQFSGK